MVNGIIGGLFVLYLFVHLLFWGIAAFEYHRFFLEREAFKETLMETRKSGRDLESAAIAKDVAKWNQELARQKYLNSLWLLDPYIDDRFEDLDPIK